jgi:ATP-dependent Lon protease
LERVPFPHAPLPALPLIVPPEEYAIFTPVKSSFWPCVGMHCASTKEKKWIVLNNVPSHQAESDHEPTHWTSEESKLDFDHEETPIEESEGVKDLNSEMPSASASTRDERSRTRSKELRRPLVWALYVQPIPAGHSREQPFGNLFQTSPLDTDSYIVTHMRRGWVCPTTGQLEICRLEPSGDKYGFSFVWPSKPHSEADAKLKSAGSASVVREVTEPAPQEGVEVLLKEETPIASSITSADDPNVVDDAVPSLKLVDIEIPPIEAVNKPVEAPEEIALKTRIEPNLEEPAVEEGNLRWPMEAKLRLGLDRIREVLEEAAETSKAIEPVLRSANWDCWTAYEVSEVVDQVTWLLNDMPGIGVQFMTLMEAKDVMWRVRFLTSILKTRFVADRYGYTAKERKRHMETVLARMGENRSELKMAMERYLLQAQQLPPSVREDVIHQITRMSTQGANEPGGVNKRVLEFILELPWNTATKDVFNMAKARSILDETHYGMEEVKKRVIELLAVNQLTGKFAKGKVLALLGPPGTGKTTIASSIATSLGRSFGQISIGGLWDVSDLKGHRRTYLASMAGQLLRVINQCKSNNPVILLDEIDKLAPGSQVATALLEILDPSQQSSFTDAWIDLPFDISNVLFVCTANWEESIHPALRDRLEVVTLEGYLEQEKFEIAKRHLLPKCLKIAGLVKGEVKITDGALKSLVKHYSPLSPGVRDLETQIQSIVNVCSLDIARNPNKKFDLTINNYEQFLPRGEFHRYEHEKSPDHPGCVSALTQLGVQQIEVLAHSTGEATGSFHVTGNLDEVMKESSQIAYTYITNALQTPGAQQSSAKAKKAKHVSLSSLATSFFTTRSIHIHLPRGGQSKQGVHAGASIALSLLSLALNRPVPADWAISGELTLHGKLLPISHMKRMVHAAQLHKIKKIVLPEDNRVHWDELPPSLKEGIQVHFVQWFYEIAELLFKVHLPRPTTNTSTTSQQQNNSKSQTHPTPSQDDSTSASATPKRKNSKTLTSGEAISISKATIAKSKKAITKSSNELL